MGMRGASGPFVTTIFIIVSLAVLLIGLFEVRVGFGAWWYSASVAFLVVVITLIAVYLVRAVNNGTA